MRAPSTLKTRAIGHQIKWLQGAGIFPRDNALRSALDGFDRSGDVMNWDEIKRSVEDNGGVLTVTMDTLRDADGAGRLARRQSARRASTVQPLRR